MAYLDDTGLAYFWGKIKAWANSVFALLGHTHPASDVTLMTGYSKPASGSAVAASDTLNQAVGKLEAKVDDALDDSGYVHKTGDELVQGVKTFSNDHSWSRSYDQHLSSVQLQSPVLDRTVNPDRSTYMGMVFLDKNSSVDLNYTSRLCAVEFGKYAESSNLESVRCSIYLKLYNPTTTTSSSHTFGVGYDFGSRFYAYAPSTSEYRTNDTDILTRDWIPKDTRIVHTSGGETIGGTKVFQATMKLAYTTVARGTNPDSKLFRALRIVDTNDEYIGNFGVAVDADGTAIAYFNAYNFVSGSSECGEIGIRYPKNGTPYTYCITPAANSNTDNIATTEWVQTYCLSTKNFVTSSGTQTITGEKTFTQSVTIERANPYLVFIETDQTRWNPGNNTAYQGIGFNDKDDADLAAIYVLNYTNSCSMRFYTHAKNSDNSDNSAYLEFNGGGSGTAKSFSPYPTKTCSLGNSSHLYTQLYANTTTISTSDEKEKSNIESIPDEVLDAWEEVSFCSFQFNDALAQKGAAARIHSGLVSQRVHEIFGRHGLDGFRYAFLCRDQGEAVDRDEKKSDGTVHHFHEDAYDNWGIRYEEALCMEAACQRRRADRAEARIAALEDRLAALELRLGSE